MKDRQVIRRARHSATVSDLKRKRAFLTDSRCRGGDSLFLEPVTRDDWQSELENSIRELATNLSARMELVTRLEQVESQIQHVLERVDSLTNTTQVEIRSFAPLLIQVLSSIPVVIQPSDDEFTATFFDASICASGDTQIEAVDNLKDTILALFTRYSAEESKLGPKPTKQLAVLRQFIKESR